jgi:hypothetical protein
MMSQVTKKTYAEFQVWGVGIGAYFHAFRQYPSVGDKLFVRFGIIPREGEIPSPKELAEIWYPLDQILAATQAIVDEVGATTAYAIGKKVGEHAALPPDVTTIQGAMMGMDIGYHIHHRKNGEPMFDPATGAIADGIGHYLCQLGDASSLIMTVDAPYQCDLDRGIVAGVATRFEPALSVTHMPGDCRKKGASACQYRVEW